MISLKEGSILIDDITLKYADKATIKRDKSVKTRNTLSGTLNTSGYVTGGTISVSTIILPSTLQEVNRLEQVLDSGHIEQVKVTGTAYLKDGTPYKRTITGLRANLTTDDEEWNPEDGIIASLDFKVDIIQKENEA